MSDCVRRLRVYRLASLQNYVMILDYILIVDGNLTLSDMPGNGDIFNHQGNSAAVVITGTLNIHSGYTELNGIFIANAVNLAYTRIQFPENIPIP